ncbi:MAG: hypothetical protein V4801_10575 [Burkholderia gladioli]
MEPVWEYRWLYDDMFYGPQDTNWWMTDWEAEHWHAYGKEGSMRIDETRRDRTLQKTMYEQPMTTVGRGKGPDKEQPLPQYGSPSVDLLRTWWNAPASADDGEVRRLVLEVIALRRKLRDAGLGDSNGCSWPNVTVRDKREPKPHVRKARRR